MGRFRPVVTVCDLSGLATCYAESTGRVRPEATGFEAENIRPANFSPARVLQASYQFA
jgi:hypothetical protein